MQTLETENMSEIDKLVLNSLNMYDDEADYCKTNNIDPEFFKQWKQQGHNDDGFMVINDCIRLGADDGLPEGRYPITTIHEITKLVETEISESDFYEVIDMLNDDAREAGENESIIDIDDMYQVVETFIDYCFSGAGELAAFPLGRSTATGEIYYCFIIATD